MKNKDKSQFWIYTVFIIVILIAVFFFSGEYLETKRENIRIKHEANNMRANWEYTTNRLQDNILYYEQCQEELRAYERRT